MTRKKVDKYKRQETLGLQFANLPKSSRWTDFYKIWHVIILVKILYQWLRGFLFCEGPEGSKFFVSRRKAWSPSTRCFTTLLIGIHTWPLDWPSMTLSGHFSAYWLSRSCRLIYFINAERFWRNGRVYRTRSTLLSSAGIALMDRCAILDWYFGSRCHVNVNTVDQLRTYHQSIWRTSTDDSQSATMSTDSLFWFGKFWPRKNRSNMVNPTSSLGHG